MRQLLLHLAQEETGERDYGIRQNVGEFPPEFDDFRYPMVESILALLESTHDASIRFLETLTPADLTTTIVTPWGPQYSLLEMTRHIIEHEIHHREELSLILGLLDREGLNA